MSNGCATISAIVALENARPADSGNPASKSLHFDAHLHFSHGHTATHALAVFRYFNHMDITFHPDDVTIAFVVANVAKIPIDQKNSNLASPGIEIKEYSMIGDIIYLIPAGSEVNPKHRPIIHASGIVTLAVPEKSTFLLSLEQYISSLRSSDNSKKPLCPLRCIISDSKRWGEKGERKPKPKQGTYVSVTGFISGISRGSEGKFEAFEVEIENVTYLGKPSTPMASWSDTPSPKLETPAKHKLKFSYDDATPTFTRKKQRLEMIAASSSQESTKDLECDLPALEYVDSPLAATK